MGTTTFSGPVVSNNGFISGTASDPISVTTAGNINASYATTSATTGDTRLMYDKLTFTSTGSGETLRAFSVVTGAGAAAGGTINGAHISMSVNSGGTISGAANALRATLGVASGVTPGGTLAAIQVDSDFPNTVTLPGSAAFLRFTNSNTGTVTNLMNVPVAMLAASSDSANKKIRCVASDGSTFYLLAVA